MLLLLAFGGTAGLFLCFFFCPIVVCKIDNLIPLTDKLEKGNIFKPLEGINATEIYFVFSRNDLSEGLVKTRVLRTTNKEQIKKFKHLFEFIYSGGDLVTCESYMCVYDSKNLVFKSNLAVTKNQHFGLQNHLYGWAVSNNSSELIKLLNEFKPYRYPILVL